MASGFLLFFLAVINFCASVLLGTMAFGDVPLLHLTWQVTQQLMDGELVGDADAVLSETYSSDVMFVTVLSSLRNIIILPYLAYLARDGFQPALFTTVSVCQCITVAIGVELLSRINANSLKPGFMVFLIGGAIVFAVFSLKKMSSGAPNPIEKPGPLIITGGILVGAIVSSMVAGITTGLLGIGSPAILVFILYQQLPPQVVRGTYPAANAVVAFVRALYTLYRGQYYFRLWPYYLVGVGAGTIGIAVGNMLGKKLNQWVFNILVVCLLFMTGVSMSTVTVQKLGGSLTLVCMYIAYAVHMAKKAPSLDHKKETVDM